MQKDRQERNTINQIENVKKSKRSSKNQKYVSLDQEVVYNLIHIINMYSHNSESKQEEQKQGVKQKYIKFQVLQRNGIKRTDINEILFSKIKPIPYNSMNDIRMKIRASLISIYLQKLVCQTEQFKWQLVSEKSPQQLFKQSIEGYVSLSQLLKQSSIPTPVQQGFYQQYSHMWQQFIQNIESEHCNEPNHQALVQKQLKNYKRKILQIWLDIPHQVLSDHLYKFGIAKYFGEIHEQRQFLNCIHRMVKQITSLVLDNRIQQCCTYYQTYCLTKYSKQFNVEISQYLRQFQDQVLIPKITKSDHIFSLHVQSLFRSNKQLKQRLLNSAELNPAVGVRIVDLLKQDGRLYYNVYMYCLKQHYKSIIYDHSSWYMVEDKLSFNINFVEWYAEDLAKVMLKREENNDRLQKIIKQLNKIKNMEDLQLSILQRNNVINFQHTRLKDKKFQRIPNPLYQKDRFDCAEIIIQQIDPDQKQQGSNNPYLRFQQFLFQQKDIKFIDRIDQKFEQMCQTLLKGQSKPIGFDTQFRCVSTKYQQQGVSIIQLSTQTDHYIIDYLKMQNQPQLNQFIIKLLCNQEYVKVGHTISSDIRYLRLTLQISEQMCIKSFIDITSIFKSLHPAQKYSSLSFLCLKYLDRKLSKYQQRSNWNRRPLKKTQIHYAALDAYACVLIYNKMKSQQSELIKDDKIHHQKAIIKVQNNIQKQTEPEQESSNIIMKNENSQSQNQMNFKRASEPQNTNYIGDFYRSDRMIHHRKYQNLLKSQQPKFLVDNMLKKLSSVMRNCGMDAQYIAIRDYNLATQLAQKQNRIILTRDTKFFQRKDNRIPIYLIKQRTDSDKMFQQVVQFFKIDLKKFKTLSRCVKCNGPQLVIIPTKQAMNQVNFKHQETEVMQFWRCIKCKQIYWEGGQFAKAKAKYGNFKKQ